MGFNCFWAGRAASGGRKAATKDGTVARGSHGVHQSLRQFGMYVIWFRMTKRNCLFCLVS